MNISFFGSSLVSSYWNGACTYYRGLLKEMARLGHDITFYEPDAYDRQKHRDMPDPPWARVVVYPATSDGWRRALETAGREADLLVKASGVGVFDEELERALPDVSSRAISAFWDVDAPATLEQMTASPSHPLRTAVPRYDIVFTYGGGEPVVRGYESVGARRCIPIYNAVDPETHFPVAPREDFACDLSLLANRLPDREDRVEEFFLKAATAWPSRHYLLGGAGWESRTLPKNVRHIGHVGTAEHNAFFCSGMATLNVNRISMARYGFSPPTRIFEAAGTGACLITDDWEGIAEFLEPGREILVASNGGDVAEHLNRLTPERAREIGCAARERVLAQHTYALRARQASDAIDALAGKAKEAAE